MSGRPQPPRGGLSLYADLLEPSADSPATISSAPVLYNEPEEQQPAKNQALRFQPIRRPQAKQKPKPTFPKPIAKPAPAPPASTPKSTLADWAAREEDEWQYGAAAAEKRQRGGRKNKKKRHEERAETDWDELYDPARPTNVEEYLRSDERIGEIREWKDLLYRRRNGADSDEQEEEEDERPSMSNQFAPPPNYSFAPPPPSPPREPAPDDKTGDEAFARRVALSQSAPAPAPPPEDQGVVISRAPVWYSPAPEAAHGARSPTPPDSELRTSRPGQKGFAQRLMSKYGWTKGSALGASESGIATPLRVQVEKRKKRSDAEGGGWAEPAARARILGGERKGGDDGGPGAMSEVIVLGNMLDGMADLEGEIEAGLGQEIGEECGDKYGRVERLYIDTGSRQVFIKFTDQVSALRAVNELKGRIFNGNAIEPRFHDAEKFEKGEYR